MVVGTAYNIDYFLLVQSAQTLIRFFLAQTDSRFADDIGGWYLDTWICLRVFYRLKKTLQAEQKEKQDAVARWDITL